jgi:hypothetical protein
MNLGTRIIDIEHPALIGVFGGVHLRGGRQHASVKYPGAPMRYIPIERVQPANRGGPKPVTAAEYSLIEARHGKSRDELHRLAKANGVTIRVAADAFLECDESCSCDGCRKTCAG